MNQVLEQLQSSARTEGWHHVPGACGHTSAHHNQQGHRVGGRISNKSALNININQYQMPRRRRKGVRPTMHGREGEAMLIVDNLAPVLGAAALQREGGPEEEILLLEYLGLGRREVEEPRPVGLGDTEAHLHGVGVGRPRGRGE